MGIEHLVKEGKGVACPACRHVTDIYTYEQRERIYYCINPFCTVERMHESGIVEVVDGRPSEGDGCDHEKG